MNSIWNSALNILARREHSRHELTAKLRKRFPDVEDQIEPVLDRLQDSGLQNDRRYAEMWLRSQVSRGRGPVRIRGEARQKGVESLVAELLSEQDIDWFELALDLALRKFPSGVTFESKAKAYRFLSYRGFESDSVQYAISELSQHAASDL